MGHGGDLADIGQKLVAQPFAFVRPFDKARNVHELDDSGNQGGDAVALGVDLRQGIEALIGERDDTDVFINRRKGVVGRDRARLGDCVKESGLAHIGQPDNSDS